MEVGIALPIYENAQSVSGLLLGERFMTHCSCSSTKFEYFLKLLPLVLILSGYANHSWSQNPLDPIWAFEETFDGDPASPSQDLLPRNFDYTVTHRIHPRDMLSPFPSYRADHGLDCAGPVGPTPAMHDVVTSHFSSGASPDKSFFICKNHMMSSMGDVSGYSVTSFWPRQEFDFADGGVLEFEVNVNENPSRFWWEIVISPREQLKVASAEDFWPIDETYPEDRIRFSWLQADGKRRIGVGTNAHAPDGWLVNETSFRTPRFLNPNDPALTDRTIRRRMRLSLESNRIHWDMELADGSMHRYSVDVPGGLPFTRGLVLFKTHAYTPNKSDNYDFTTWHWDNIRFDGPKLEPYVAVESPGLLYLEHNGNRPIGDSGTKEINLNSVGTNPRLFGQIHAPIRGQVLLSVNGNPAFTVHPHHYLTDDCYSNGWSSFLIDIPAGQLKSGNNIFRWTVGPRPACAEYVWDGFTIKDMELQFDSGDSGGGPGPATLSINDVSVDESTGIGTFTVTRSPANHNDTVSALVAASQTGTASHGVDYYGFAKSVTFLPGENQKTVDVVILNDSEAGEGSETLGVRLLRIVNATATKPEGVMTIIDDD